MIRSGGSKPSQRVHGSVPTHSSTAASLLRCKSPMSRLCFFFIPLTQLFDCVSTGLLTGSSLCSYPLLIAFQSPILIVKDLVHIFRIVLDAILHLVSSLFVTICDSSFQQLLWRYCFPTHNCWEEREVSRMDIAKGD